MHAARRTERFELVVIGGGQAGLAIGYWLAKHDIDFVILDANARTGDAWRNRWDSLKLFTPARYSGLPGLGFDGDPYRFPTRDEVADYLEWYARVFELPVRHNVQVSKVRRTGSGYEITSHGTTFEADNVIVATGPLRVPRVPAFASEIDPAVVQLHSSEYRKPAQLPDGAVLVVGAGNSGSQIARELAKTRTVYLAGRAVGSMPRRVLGRDVFDWLWHTVMIPGAESMIGRRIRANILGSTDALIGLTEKDLRVPNLTRIGRVTHIEQGQPKSANDALPDVASVVWCTGFRPDYSWIELPAFDADGFPMHQRGITAVSGLYFVGLRFQHRLNSSLIGGVGADAQFVADAVASRYGRSRKRTAA